MVSETQAAEPSASPSLRAVLTEASEALYYPSESDEPFEYVELTFPPEAEPLSERSVAEFLGRRPNNYAEEISLEDFFEPVTTVEDWYENEDRNTVDQYFRLKDVLQTNLTDVRVFRVGRVEIDVYLIGKTGAEGQYAGLKTQVTETE
jgi:hypothetical protein